MTVRDGFSVGGGLKMANFNASLQGYTLRTGGTTKSRDIGQTGQFGEGMKLSALVFRRNGYKYHIESTGFKWDFTYQQRELACKLTRIRAEKLKKQMRDAQRGPRTVESHSWEDDMPCADPHETAGEPDSALAAVATDESFNDSDEDMADAGPTLAGSSRSVTPAAEAHDKNSDYVPTPSSISATNIDNDDAKVRASSSLEPDQVQEISTQPKVPVVPVNGLHTLGDQIYPEDMINSDGFPTEFDMYCVRDTPDDELYVVKRQRQTSTNRSKRVRDSDLPLRSPKAPRLGQGYDKPDKKRRAHWASFKTFFYSYTRNPPNLGDQVWD